MVNDIQNYITVSTIINRLSRTKTNLEPRQKQLRIKLEDCPEDKKYEMAKAHIAINKSWDILRNLNESKSN